MKPLRISEDVVPIGKFKPRASVWFRKARETGRPFVVTQNGEAAAVVLAPDDYDRLQYTQALLASIAQGAEDAEAGRSVDTATLRARLASRRKERRGP
jgi:prevent-host-death family protein